MSSGFITESEAAEVRKRRQEEWEKVRNADDPVERPEEKFDPRSLFERLQEQKQKKDLEYEEAHKLKNMIKGLDDDEIEFLDLVDRTKLAADRKKSIEEELELHDYRNRVATLQEKTLDRKLQVESQSVKPKLAGNRNSQIKLLKGVVVKKNESRKRKMSDTEEPNAKSEKTETNETEDQKTQGDQYKAEENKDEEAPSSTQNDRMQCIGILPGLGYYGDSSSDEVSSDSDESLSIKEQCDILGRKLIATAKKVQAQPPSQQN